MSVNFTYFCLKNQDGPQDKRNPMEKKEKIHIKYSIPNKTFKSFVGVISPILRENCCCYSLGVSLVGLGESTQSLVSVSRISSTFMMAKVTSKTDSLMVL